MLQTLGGATGLKRDMDVTEKIMRHNNSQIESIKDSYQDKVVSQKNRLLTNRQSKSIETITGKAKGRPSKLLGIDKTAFFNTEMPESMLKSVTSKFKIDKRDLLPFCQYKNNDILQQLGQEYRAVTA